MKSSSTTAGAVALAAALVVLAMPTTAEVLAHIVYTPTSLPSAQGWEYIGDGLAEQDVFSVADGVLIMDTMGTGVGGTPMAMYMYQFDESFDAGVATIRWRLRVTDAENQPHPYFRGFSFSAWPFNSFSEWYVFNIDDAGIYVEQRPLQDLDTTVWRDYTLRCILDDWPGTVELLVDGQSIPYPADEYHGGLSRTIFFGDRGYHANARVEISEIEIIVATDAPVATERHSLSAIRSLFHR